MVEQATEPKGMPTDWKDFLALTKPRVMGLVTFTGLCGLLAAPGHVHPVIAFTAILCIAMGGGAAGALNQWYEADLDTKMKRTRNRPLPARRMDSDTALQFGIFLGFLSVCLMYLAVNLISAIILSVSILYYVFVYTVWLKRRTPQNIVIGGAAGAFPPVIGWTAVTEQISLMPVLLFLLIFFWTPPHAWAVALFVKADYGHAGVPMLPVVAGERKTREMIVWYTLPMIVASLLPWLLGLAGILYGVGALALNVGFFYYAMSVLHYTKKKDIKISPERNLFIYSMIYLFLIFILIVFDGNIELLFDWQYFSILRNLNPA